MAEEVSIPQSVLDKLFDLTEKTGKSAGEIASSAFWVKIAIGAVAAAIGTLAVQSYNLNRNVGELTVTMIALTTSIGSLAESHEKLALSINKIEDGQTELNTTVGTLRSSVDDLKKKL